MDPPYRDDLIVPILDKVAEITYGSGVIICEIPKGESLAESAGEFELARRYRYGKTELALYRAKDTQTEIY